MKRSSIVNKALAWLLVCALGVAGMVGPASAADALLAYQNYPLTAAMGTHFTGVSQLYQVNGVGATNIPYFANDSGDAYAYFDLTTPPTGIVSMQQVWQWFTAAAVGVGEEFQYIFRNAAGDILVKLSAIPEVALADNNATYTLKLVTNVDATGYSLTGIKLDNGGVDYAQIVTLLADPATGKAWFTHAQAVTATTDPGDGTRPYWFTARPTGGIAYTGVISRLELRLPRMGGHNAAMYLHYGSWSVDPWVGLGDSLTGTLLMGLGQRSTTIANQYMPIPYVRHGIDGCLLNHNEQVGATSVYTRWKTNTVDQGFRKVILIAGTNDLHTTGSASEPSMEADAESVLAGLYRANCKVIVYGVPPRGLANGTQERDAATKTAALTYNTYLKGRCSTYNFLFVDNYTILGDGTGKYLNENSTDGVHPDSSATKIAAAAVAGMDAYERIVAPKRNIFW